MVDSGTIKLAKEVDVNEIVDNFGWERSSGNHYMIKCPDRNHDEKTPSCAFNIKNNTFHCFGCGKTFDSILLFKELEFHRSGNDLSFPDLVEEVLSLGNVSKTISHNAQPSNQNTNVVSNNTSSSYQRLLSNCRPMKGYELDYLHRRGIFLYDAYIFEGMIYTQRMIDNMMQGGYKDEDRACEIMGEGCFYEGIAPILRANHVEVLHNYYNGINSVVYKIEYEESEVSNTCFLKDTSRHILIQKTLDNAHNKKCMGNNTFTFLTEGLSGNDIYVCEGLEDGFCYVQHGFKTISLNSVSNLYSFMNHIKNNVSLYQGYRFIISFDHDEGGEKATQKLAEFFEEFNQQNVEKINYALCNYPAKFHDINDYWVDKVFG